MPNLPKEPFYSLGSLFEQFCLDLSGSYDIERAGIVELDPIQNEFVVVCQWHKPIHEVTSNFSHQPPEHKLYAHRFARNGSVGDWVIKHNAAFIGHGKDAVNEFPTTLRDFEKEGLQSNYVNLFDHNTLRLFFALSASGKAFAQTKVLDDRLLLLKHSVAFAQNCGGMENLHEVVNSEVVELLRNVADVYNQVPSFAQWEKAYLSALLKLTSSRIEGQAGAAQLAGLKPSTFRYRLQKYRMT